MSYSVEVVEATRTVTRSYRMLAVIYLLSFVTMSVTGLGYGHVDNFEEARGLAEEFWDLQSQCAVQARNCNRVRKSESSENGLCLTLPEGWQQLHLGPDYRGVAAYCDAGIVEVLIERLPFDEETRTGDLDRQVVSSRKKELLKTLGRFKGHGNLVSGLTAEGDRMSFLVFYPDPPTVPVAILVIYGEANERQKLELEAVVHSLRVVSCE